MGLTTAIENAVSRKSEMSDARLFDDGAIVGSWRILALLGKGGNGEVYRAEHVKSGVLGALKATMPRDPHLRRRFDLELTILTKIATVRNAASKPTKGLRHLPYLLDESIDAQTKIPYFVVELLQDMEPPKKSPAVRKLILNVCEAVRELHKIGYLHRDIKLENLMWRKKKEVVLIDFGLSCQVEDAANPFEKRISLTQGRIFGVGTEGASAPEQMFGHASVKSDIYAIGALADNCFGGKPPAEWGRIILGAINPRSECRFKDMDQFVDAVKSDVPRWAWSGFIKRKWAVLVICLSCASAIINHPSSNMDAQPPEDHEQLYRRAIQGNIRAQNALGECYYYGRGTLRNVPEAEKWFRKAAEQGLKEAQNNLGICYRNNRDRVILNKEKDEAVKWFRKAAEQGLKEAQNNLALCYYRGFGVPEDKVEAVKWLQKAAEQGSESALSFLVDHYASNKLDSTDKTTAILWYRKAAEQGNLTAQYRLGECYANGDGVVIDKVEADKWYQRAAAQLDAQAQYNLGNCYYNGDGVTIDKSQAVKWYRKAAEQANMMAQYALGKCYENGDGVPESKVEAMRWYDKAAKQGLKEAAEALIRVYKNPKKSECL